KIADKIIAYLKQNTIDELYISYDIDALDASYASATGTPELNGLSPHESMIILQELAASFPFGGADLVEVAPFLATDLKGESPEPQTTLLSATTLIRFIISKMGED
ncbi:MAG: arginase family protein, partial [Halobacteriovoraceae bacterium]|nr:arginase family protein [Halobacteriovoraceae bacterium]